ncbi:UrcA family protein [Aurantiacibacter gilvus]|uniref:UrcA family protein n=1 Tax=Aurantiacibacter gilvus TaxID=3139141 RepID=A0ABU9IA71_9SPHN
MTKGNTMGLAIAFSLVATNAQAAEEEVSFHYNPEELADQESAAKLSQRVRRTAREACRRSATAPRRLVRECRRSIEEQLLTQIDLGDRPVSIVRNVDLHQGD